MSRSRGLTNCNTTRRMAIANGTCFSFCNQPKAHYLATSRESRRYIVAFRFAAAGIWLRQESLRHILASPGYAPGTIAVNVTWIERGFKACQTHRSMYASIFNRFQVIQPVSSKVRHFSTFFFFTFWPLLSTPLRQSRQMLYVSKENSMLVKRIVACTHTFNRLRAIARYWSEIATFAYPPPCI